MVADSRTATNGADYWERVLLDGCALPSDRPLDELTVDLGRLLGSSDPHERDDIAYAVLAAWIGRGVYDDLLTGLGDGMSSGLRTGLGDEETDSVFRRSFSCLVLAELIARDNEAELLHPTTVLRWGDRALGWFVRERDLRGYVTGRGWAHTVAHGADLLGTLALSRHLGRDELGVLLDTVGDRLLAPTPYRLRDGEDDRLGYATMATLHRNLLGMDTLRPWVDRLAAAARPRAEGEPAPAEAYNTMAYARALYLQLQLGVRALRPGRTERHLASAVEVRIDLLGALARMLRSASECYRPPAPVAGSGP